MSDEKVKLPYETTRAKCPKCGHEGPVLPDFGVREVNGELHAQTWCKKCRGETVKRP